MMNTKKMKDNHFAEKGNDDKADDDQEADDKTDE